MELFVGLDVSQNETSVCVIDGAGRTCWQGRCASTPEAIASTVAARAPGAVRVVLETGVRHRAGLGPTQIGTNGERAGMRLRDDLPLGGTERRGAPGCPPAG